MKTVGIVAVSCGSALVGLFVGLLLGNKDGEFQHALMECKLSKTNIEAATAAYSGVSRTVIPIHVGQQSGRRRTEFRRMSDSNPVAAGQ